MLTIWNTYFTSNVRNTEQRLLAQNSAEKFEIAIPD
jgi:hypothetical protein